jgi:hypothetical protein
MSLLVLVRRHARRGGCRARAARSGRAARRQTRKDIDSMCSSHSMDGCQDCSGTGFSSCPRPLETLSRLCLGAPPGCAAARHCPSTSYVASHRRRVPCDLYTGVCASNGDVASN